MPQPGPGKGAEGNGMVPKETGFACECLLLEIIQMVSLSLRF